MYNTITKSNTGGCNKLVGYFEKENENAREYIEGNKEATEKFTDYLDKENALEGSPVDMFFNGEDKHINKDEVINKINNNTKKLGEKETKFYSLTFNLSKREINHLDKIADNEIKNIRKSGVEIKDESLAKEKIMRDLTKEYSVKCMDEYAKNFNREGINNNSDLVWYGKVEKNRFYKGTDKEVQHNNKIFSNIKKLQKENANPKKIENERKKLILESDKIKGGKDLPIEFGMPKSGDNYHVHVIVSRKDKTNSIKLSPLAKQKKNDNHIVGDKKNVSIGFDRNEFSHKIEQAFDREFRYRRDFKESFIGHKTMKYDKENYSKEKPKWRAERTEKGLLNTREKEFKKSRNKDLAKGKQVGMTIANKVGLSYISEELSPYLKAYKLGKNILKFDKGIINAIKTGDINKVTKATVLNKVKSKGSKKVASKLLQKSISNYASIVGLSNPASAVMAITKGLTNKIIQGTQGRGIE